VAGTFSRIVGSRIRPCAVPPVRREAPASDCVLDPMQSAGDGGVVDHGADEDFWVERVACVDGLAGVEQEPFAGLFVDRFVDEDTLDADTGLAGVSKRPGRDQGNGLLNVGVGMENYHRVPAQFEGATFAGGLSLQSPADRSASCKSDHPDPFVSDPRSDQVRWDKSLHSGCRGEAGGVDGLGEQQGREGSPRGRFEDECVASG